MISIIICSIDEAKFRAVSENYASLLGDQPYELIRIPDAKSLCEGYNRGFRRSKGRTIILCHDDIEILNADFKHRLHQHLERFDLIGVAGTTRMTCGNWAAAATPYCYGQVAEPSRLAGRIAVRVMSAPTRAVGGIQALDGLFLAARREVVERVGFDEQNFDGFHLYDADFTFRAYQAGFRLGVCCDINIYHASPGAPDDNWHKAMANFERKFQNQLYKMELKPFYFSEVAVTKTQDILEIMNPPHWPAE